jgi:hypothetical protein
VTKEGQGRIVAYLISPEALQRCLREHLQDLQKRNISSSTILAVFNQFCYVPKHTVREQLLQVREAKREQAAYESATLFESGDRQCGKINDSEMADRRGDWLAAFPLHTRPAEL